MYSNEEDGSKTLENGGKKKSNDLQELLGIRRQSNSQQQKSLTETLRNRSTFSEDSDSDEREDGSKPPQPQPRRRIPGTFTLDELFGTTRKATSTSHNEIKTETSKEIVQEHPPVEQTTDDFLKSLNLVPKTHEQGSIYNEVKEKSGEQTPVFANDENHHRVDAGASVNESQISDSKIQSQIPLTSEEETKVHRSEAKDAPEKQEKVSDEAKTIENEKVTGQMVSTTDKILPEFGSLEPSTVATTIPVVESSKPVSKPSSGAKSGSRRTKSSSETRTQIDRDIYSASTFSPGQTFANSLALRSAAYQEWTQRKLQSMKVKQKQLSEQRQQEELKKTEKLARLANAETTFEAWKRQRDESLKTKRKEDLRKQNEKQQTEKSERESKLKESESMFRAWIKEKNVKLKEERQKKKQKEQETKLEKEDEQRRKREDAMKTFEAWKKAKDESIREVVKDFRQRHNSDMEQRRLAELKKDAEAQQAFQVWLEVKEREKLERIILEATISRSESLMSPMPWIPPNSTVPYGARRSNSHMNLL